MEPARRIGGKRVPARRTQKPAKTREKAHCTGTSRRAKRRAHSKCAICTITVRPNARAERHFNQNGALCMGVFHRDCLTKWLSQQFSGGTCPYCRHKVQPEAEMEELCEWREYLVDIFQHELENNLEDIEMMATLQYPDMEYTSMIEAFQDEVQSSLSRAMEAISASNAQGARDELNHVEDLTWYSFQRYSLELYESDDSDYD